MDIYIDESIHERANFIALSAVCLTIDQVNDASQALLECGFTPGRDEFKSSMRMHDNEQARRLREMYRDIIQQAKVGIAICAIKERHLLMSIAAKLARTMVAQTPGTEGTIFLDEGMKRQHVELPRGYRMISGCNSASVIGIQIADCCAHAVATILLGTLGVTRKTIQLEENRDGSADAVDLSWFLWASMRHALTSSRPVTVNDHFFDDPNYHPYGLEISDGCDIHVRDAAIQRFGSVWLGCIN